MNVLTKFHGKPSNLHTLLIHLKRRDSLEKRVRVFAFQRFINISRLHRGMCQLEKPRANEITEPLAFTVCKLKLRGNRDSVKVTFKAHTIYPSVVNYGKNETKATSLVRKKQTNQGRSAAAQVLSRHTF